MMKRREFITLIGGAATWPLPARAQRQLPVIGLLSTNPIDAVAGRLAPFRKGLAEAGYVEGRNVTIEYRSAGAQRGPLQGLAAELVRLPVNMIVAIGSSSSALAAKAATSTIPIVFAMGGDPIDSGLVTSLARPEANVTGVTVLASELTAKRLELVRDLLPAAKLVGYLGNPDNVSLQRNLRSLQEGAGKLGLQMIPFMATTAAQIDSALTAMVQSGVDVLIIASDPLFESQGNRIVEAVARSRLPAISGWSDLTKRGGLLSYSADVGESMRQAGIYTGRILKGEKPADLPVQPPTKFELILNLKTAQALGLPISREFLLRADEVLE
jgi:putative ABC transport system substrate-binding protein